MKPTRHVTAVLLLAAFAAVGCSKRDDTVQARRDRQPPRQSKPVAADESVRRSRPTRKGSWPDATPTITGPVSFADGEAAYQARKYSDATAIFERYTAQRPDNAWGHYMLGLSAWKSGDLAKSEQAFEKALSVDPHHVKSLVNLSRVFIEQKRHDEAVDRLTRAAEIDPESTEVYRLLGRTYHAQGQDGRGRRRLSSRDRAERARRVVDEQPRAGVPRDQRADEALPLLAKAVELRQDVPVFHNNLGMALEHTGRFKAAAAAYQAAWPPIPDYDKAKQNLARVEAVKSDF